MRSILFALLSIAIIIPALAQDTPDPTPTVEVTATESPKCRYEIDQIDRFTDDITRQTRSIKIWKGFYEEEFISCAAVRKNDVRAVQFAYYAHAEYLVEEGDSLMLLLDNKEVLILQAATKRLAERFSDKIFYANVSYPLDAQNMQLLLDNNIKAVRLYYKGGFFEKEIKEKKQGAVKDLLTCVE